MRGNKLFSSGHIAALFLLVLIIFHAIANVWWLKTDTVPPMWDEAAHAYATLVIAQKMFAAPVLQVVNTILATSPYPPLGYVISAVITKFT